MLMQMGQTNIRGGVGKVKKTSVFSPQPHAKRTANVIGSLLGENRAADYGTCGRKSIQRNSGMLMRMKGYKKALTKSVSLQLRIRGDPAGIVIRNNSAVSS